MVAPVVKDSCGRLVPPFLESRFLDRIFVVCPLCEGQGTRPDDVNMKTCHVCQMAGVLTCRQYLALTPELRAVCDGYLDKPRKKKDDAA